MNEAIRKFLDRIDPNDDPSAEPLTVAPLVAFALMVSTSVWLFLRFKIQPMQDLGHHLAMSAIVADWGRPGSIYTEIYTKPDLLNANSLLYTLSGYAGRLIGVGLAVRICLASYLAGVPLATLYGLRVFGRSPWAAVMAVPFTYCMSWVAGFANFVFAAPFLVLGVPLFYRMLREPKVSRVAFVAVWMVLTFLAHVHVFLWLGVLTFAMTISAIAVSFVRRARMRFGGHEIADPARLAGAALLAVIPSLLLLRRWFMRSSVQAADEVVTYKVGAVDVQSTLGARKTLGALFADMGAYVKTLNSEDDHLIIIAALALLGFALAVSRWHRWRRPPVLELAALLSFLSYFALPEATETQAVIGSRQIGIALWFAPVFFSPVPARVSRWGRWLVIAGILVITRQHLVIWTKWLVDFHRRDAMGLKQVLDAAPARKRLTYVDLAPESFGFPWHSFWHVDKWYMADKFGQVVDNPAVGAMNCIRYKNTYVQHRVLAHHADWATTAEIWANFDLVLVHKWKPTPKQLATALDHAFLVRKVGDWELWQNKL